MLKIFFVKSAYASYCTNDKTQEGANSTIIVDHKPIKKPRQGICYIRVLRQDHKPPIHLTLVECEIDLFNGQPLWRTLVSTHFEPNIARIVQKFTPSIFLSLAWERSVYSGKKKLKYKKVSYGPFTIESLILNWLYPRVNFKKKEMHVLHKQLQLQTNYYLTQEGNYNSGTDIFMPVTLNGAV